MNSFVRRAIPSILTIALCAAAHGQAMPAAGNTGPFYKLHGADVGVAATGQFTTSVTDQSIGSHGQTLPHQATTDSPGVLFTIRDQPFSWAGVEVNYQYTKLSERFSRTEPGPANGPANNPVNVTTSFHEATAAYLFHLKMRRFSPYIGVGGGGLDFVPTMVDRNQWRPTGLVDIGLDMQTHSRLGFRVGARDLTYRAPNYYDITLASSRWVNTQEPYAGVYVKF